MMEDGSASSFPFLSFFILIDLSLSISIPMYHYLFEINNHDGDLVFVWVSLEQESCRLFPFLVLNSFLFFIRALNFSCF